MHTLTQAVVAVVCKAEAVVARAPVVPWDVDALVNTSSVIIARALVDVCIETEKDKKKKKGYT